MVHVERRGRTPRPLFADDDYRQQRTFFAARPDLAPTPMRRLPALARELGLAELFIKDETARFGLNAFKAAGALFAVTTLASRGVIRRGDTLAAASEGNHGRAVARAAREAGCAARIYMSNTVAPARVTAIAAEGAEVVLVNGSYDTAVHVMAGDAAAAGWTVISDTSWEGYDEIPRLIMLGYTRLLDEDWAAAAPPDAIFVPGGVGGLLAAVACWSHWRWADARPRIVSVEPEAAACLQVSARAGQPTRLNGPFDTALGGLRCGEVSPGAFPAVLTLVDGFMTISDEDAFDAMRRLARPAGSDPPLACGASGAAALAGVRRLLTDPGVEAARTALGLGPGARVLALCTEGVTDPTLYADVLSRR